MLDKQDKELPPLPGDHRQQDCPPTKSKGDLNTAKPTMTKNTTTSTTSIKNPFHTPTLDPKKMGLSPPKSPYKSTSSSSSSSSSFHKHRSSTSLTTSWLTKQDPPTSKLYQLPNSSSGSFISSNPSLNPSFDYHSYYHRSPEFLKQTTYVLVNGLPYPTRIMFPQKISKKAREHESRDANNVLYGLQNQSTMSAGSGSPMTNTPDSASLISQFQNLPIQPHERFDTKSLSPERRSALLTTRQSGESLPPDRSNLSTGLGTEFESEEQIQTDLLPPVMFNKSKTSSSSSSSSLNLNKALNISSTKLESTDSDIGSKFSKGVDLLYMNQHHSPKEKNFISSSPKSVDGSSLSSYYTAKNGSQPDTAFKVNSVSKVKADQPLSKVTPAISIRKSCSFSSNSGISEQVSGPDTNNTSSNKAISVCEESVEQSKSTKSIPRALKKSLNTFKVNSVKRGSIDKELCLELDKIPIPPSSSSDSSTSYSSADSYHTIKSTNVEQSPVKKSTLSDTAAPTFNLDSITFNSVVHNASSDDTNLQEKFPTSSGSLNQRKLGFPKNKPRQLSPLVEMESFDDTEVERRVSNQFILYKETSTELIIPKNRHPGGRKFSPMTTRKIITMTRASESHSLNSSSSGSSDDLDEALNKMGQPPLEVLHDEEVMAEPRKSSYENPYEFMEVIYDDYIHNRKISIAYNNEGRVISRSFTPATGNSRNVSRSFTPSNVRVISRTFTSGSIHPRKVSGLLPKQRIPSYQMFNEMNIVDHYDYEPFETQEDQYICNSGATADSNSTEAEGINHKVRIKKKYIEDNNNNDSHTVQMYV